MAIVKKKRSYSKMAGYRQGKFVPRKLTKTQVDQVLKKTGELKGVDTILNLVSVLSTVDTNGNIFLLNSLATGTTAYERVGRKVMNKYVYINVNYQCHIKLQGTTNNLIGNTLRMTLVWDKQPSNVLPKFNDIFGTVELAGATTTKVLSPRKYSNMDRFQVLKDQFISSNHQAGIPTGGSGNELIIHGFIQEYVKINRESVYSANVTGIGSISSGALYLIFRSTTGDSSTTYYSINDNSSARLRYTD